MNHKIFENITDKNFYVRAFKEYVEDRAGTYEKLMALINSFLMDLTNPDVIIDDDYITDYITNNSDFHHMSYVPFNTGSIPLKSLLSQLGQRYLFSDAVKGSYDLQLNCFTTISITDGSLWTLEDLSEELGSDPLDVLEGIRDYDYDEFKSMFSPSRDSLVITTPKGRNISIMLKDVYDNLSDLLNKHPNNDEMFSDDISDGEIILIRRDDELLTSITVESMLSEMQASLHSVVCWAAGAGAIEFENISERLSYARDYIARTFVNAYQDLSGTLDMIVNVLEKATSISDFFSVFNARNGIDDEELDYTKHDAYAITGASPVGPLDFGSVAKATETVLKKGFELVSGFGKMLYRGAKKVFKSVTSKVKEVVVDPYDLETLDGGDTPIIDGFHYQLLDYHAQTSLPRTFLPYIDHVHPWLLERGWVKMNTLFGVILFRFKELEFEDRDYDDVLVANIICDLKFAPKPLSTKLFDPLGKQTDMDLIEGTHDVADIIEFSERFANAITPYEDTSSNEAVLFRGFANSIITLNALSFWGQQEALGVERATYLTSPGDKFTPPSEVTNLDFLKICSGWNGSEFTNRNPYSADSIVFLSVRYWLTPFLLLAFDRAINPVDYAFFPYIRGENNLGQPMYRIKTDKENYDAFNKFATWAIVIAVTAVVAIKLFVVFKRFVNVYTLKTMGLRRSIEMKLAQGEAVSPKLLKQLRKRTMITNLLSRGSSALTSAGSFSVNTDLTPILERIG